MGLDRLGFREHSATIFCMDRGSFNLNLVRADSNFAGRSLQKGKVPLRLHASRTEVSRMHPSCSPYTTRGLLNRNKITSNPRDGGKRSRLISLRFTTLLNPNHYRYVSKLLIA